ncbi:hypothetical protein ACFQZS_12500 [Mucilaginibacter calamicampi]|uniref:Outer membrane protein beta-barrel domain-containing protein n=1 Tax=Mucilaginibacter calamicampi TaxID=1302352 RepID=A0ABW2YWV1_9SPHI
MKDEQHKNIDDVFRRVMENPANEPEYRPDHWNALDEMLNGKKKPGKLVYWLPLSAAAMLLIALGWWYFTPQHAENANSAQQLVIKKSTGAVTGQRPDVAAGLKTAPIVSQDQQGANMAVLSADKPNLGTGDRSIDKPNLGTADRYTGKPNLALVSPNGAAVKEDGKVAAIINPVNRDDRFIILEQPKQFILPNTAIANHSIKPVNVNESIGRIARVAQDNKAKDESWLKKPRLALTVLSSADINGLNSFNNTGTGKNIGMLFSARFKKLSISTGAYYSYKPYTMPFSAYSPNSAYKFKYSPESVTADCRMLDIPLNIDYQVFEKNQNSISVGTGISSFVMLKENYQYNYSTSHVYGSSSYNVANPDKYLFSSVNFQANYRRQINSKIGVNVMPYVKIPLNDIGYSRVKLQTVGVAVGLNWNINSLPKPK